MPKFLSDIDNASRIIQNTNNRMVSDTEKTDWNSKADGNHHHDEVYQLKSPEIRRIFVSTSEPTANDGENGDLWLIRES